MLKRKKIILFVILFIFALTSCSPKAEDPLNTITYTMHSMQIEVEESWEITESSGGAYIFPNEAHEPFFLLAFAPKGDDYNLNAEEAEKISLVLLGQKGELLSSEGAIETTIGGETAWVINATILENNNIEMDCIVWMVSKGNVIYAIIYSTPHNIPDQYEKEVETLINSILFIDEVYTQQMVFNMQFELKNTWRFKQEESAVVISFPLDESVLVILGAPSYPASAESNLDMRQAEQQAIGIVNTLGDPTTECVVKETTIGECEAYAVSVNLIFNDKEKTITFWVWQRENTIYRCTYISDANVHEAYLGEVKYILNSIIYTEILTNSTQETVEDGILELFGMQLYVGDLNVEVTESGGRSVSLPNNVGFITIVRPRLLMNGHIVDGAHMENMAALLISMGDEGQIVSPPKPVNMNGFEGWTIQIETTRNGEQRKGTLWAFERNGYVYEFFYVSGEYYETYLHDAEVIMSTIKFID